MPCNTDYMEPTVKERQRKEAAELYVYAAEALGQRVHYDIPSGIIAAAQNMYGEGADPDIVVSGLCSLIRGMTKEQEDKIIYNGRSKLARRLADWWEEHQREDEKREWNEVYVAARENPGDFRKVLAYVQMQDNSDFSLDMIAKNVSAVTGQYFDVEDSVYIFDFPAGIIILSSMDGIIAYKGEQVV